jgi:hypothetical protein
MDKTIDNTPFLRWRHLIGTDPAYTKFIARHVAMKGLQENLDIRMLLADIYNYEYTRRNQVALVLDKIMGGFDG